MFQYHLHVTYQQEEDLANPKRSKGDRIRQQNYLWRHELHSDGIKHIYDIVHVGVQCYYQGIPKDRQCCYTIIHVQCCYIISNQS